MRSAARAASCIDRQTADGNRSVLSLFRYNEALRTGPFFVVVLDFTFPVGSNARRCVASLVGRTRVRSVHWRALGSVDCFELCSIGIQGKNRSCVYAGGPVQGRFWRLMFTLNRVTTPVGASPKVCYAGFALGVSTLRLVGLKFSVGPETVVCRYVVLFRRWMAMSCVVHLLTLFQTLWLAIYIDIVAPHLPAIRIISSTTA